MPLSPAHAQARDADMQTVQLCYIFRGELGWCIKCSILFNITVVCVKTFLWQGTIWLYDTHVHEMME